MAVWRCSAWGAVWGVFAEFLFQIFTVSEWISTNNFPGVGLFLAGTTKTPCSDLTLLNGKSLPEGGSGQSSTLLVLKSFSWGLRFPQDATGKLRTSETTSSRAVRDWQSWEQIKAGIWGSWGYKKPCYLCVVSASLK